MKVIDQLDRAAESLRQGQLLVYPTESVWGIGCDPFNFKAFERLLSLKQRCGTKGVILLGDTINRFSRAIRHLSEAERLELKRGWMNQQSQASTYLIEPAQGSIPQWIMGKHQTVGIRVTPHYRISLLIKQFGTPIVSTSCNLSGLPSAKTLQQAQSIFGDEVVYLKGETLGFDKPSRLIDFKTGQILR